MLTVEQHLSDAAGCVTPSMLLAALLVSYLKGALHENVLPGLLLPWMLPQVAPEGYLQAALL